MSRNSAPRPRSGSSLQTPRDMGSSLLSWKAREGADPTVAMYEILEKLAESGMALIYKARHTETGELAAIKVMSPEIASSDVYLKRFEQEYTTASRLDHPGIVRSLDFGRYESGPFLVMEYIEGESLGDRLSRDGPMPEIDAIALITQVAAALDYAHQQGVIHRDVKPDNILISADGVAKLADLGLVKHLLSDLDLTRPGDGLGTPAFMAPEQFCDAKNIDSRADIYALGATLYTMLTGSLPFSARSAIQIIKKKALNEFIPAIQLSPTLSARTDQAIRRAMSLDRAKRPATCAEFIKDLTGKDMPVVAVEKRAPATARRAAAPERSEPASTPASSSPTVTTPAAASAGSQEHTWWHLLIAFGLALGSALAMTYYLQAFHP